MIKKINTKHVWSVLCRKSLIDGTTNQVSLLDILEEVVFTIPKPFSDSLKDEMSLGKAAVFPFEYEVISLWENVKRTSGDSYIVEMIDPDNERKELGSGELKFENIDRLRVRIQSTHLPVKKEGRHSFIIKIKSGEEQEEVASLPFIVKLNLE